MKNSMIILGILLLGIGPINAQKLNPFVTNVVIQKVSNSSEFNFRNDTIVDRYVKFYPIENRPDSVLAYVCLLAFDGQPRIVRSSDVDPIWFHKSILPEENLSQIILPVIVMSNVRRHREEFRGNKDFRKAGFYAPLIKPDLDKFGELPIDTLILTAGFMEYKLHRQ